MSPVELEILPDGPLPQIICVPLHWPAFGQEISGNTQQPIPGLIDYAFGWRGNIYLDSIMFRFSFSTFGKEIPERANHT